MLTLRHLRQAGFLFRSGGTAFVIDAYLTPRDKGQLRPGPDPATLAPLLAVLATHEHRDHLDRPALPRLLEVAPGARVIVPAPIVDMAADAVGADRVDAAYVDRPIRIGDATITPIPARHGVHVADAYTFGLELSGGLYRYVGYVVDLGGVRVYHAGDTIRYDDQAERLRALRVDVALLPINGRDAEREARDTVGNLDHREAADLAADAGIGTVIPMHHDTIPGNTGDPEALVAYARDRHPGLRVIVPGPSEIALP